MAKKSAQRPFRVGVVGESEFDTKALRDLLHRQYGQRAQFLAMDLRLQGGQLDGRKAHTMLPLRYSEVQPDLVIIFRDLDGPANDRAKRQKREALFEEMNALVEHKGLLLLHVHTIEALLIAHVEVFQKKYGWQCRVPANPTTIPNPAQFLRDASHNRNSTRRYDKVSCPDMMELVAYDFLVSRCGYFRDFDTVLQQRIPLAIPPR